jgi:hypothetical protein
MFSTIEYVWKIRAQLKKGATNYEQILKVVGDTENRIWNKIMLMHLQVERCQYTKRDRCEICRVLLEEGGEER